jgi:hypothetical protein
MGRQKVMLRMMTGPATTIRVRRLSELLVSRHSRGRVGFFLSSVDGVAALRSPRPAPNR